MLVYAVYGFNLIREANPVATQASRLSYSDMAIVSISSEKPTPWRPRQRACDPAVDVVSISSEKPTPWRLGSIVAHCKNRCFNLIREANPVATQCRNRCASYLCFNLIREANPVATSRREHCRHYRRRVSISSEKPTPWRPCILVTHDRVTYVSISSEKPTPWRRRYASRGLRSQCKPLFARHKLKAPVLKAFQLVVVKYT